MRKLLVLEDLHIASPCNADWAEMTGDEQVRLCGRCDKNVYNVIAMTRAEAETLVRANEGDVCVRLWKRHDGTVITADCPVGVRRERLRARVWARVSQVAASAGLLLGLWSGRARADLTVRDGDKKASVPPPVMMAGAPMPMMGVAPRKTPTPPAKKAASHTAPKPPAKTAATETTMSEKTARATAAE